MQKSWIRFLWNNIKYLLTYKLDAHQSHSTLFWQFANIQNDKLHWWTSGLQRKTNCYKQYFRTKYFINIIFINLIFVPLSVFFNSQNLKFLIEFNEYFCEINYIQKREIVNLREIYNLKTSIENIESLRLANLYGIE